MAARRAVERSSASALAATLKKIVQQLPGTGAPREFTVQAQQFHRAVVSAARSDRTQVVLQALSTMVPGDFFTLVPEAMPIERRGLRAIVSAIAAGDGGRAGQEYIDMMNRVGTCVGEVFAARGLLSDG